MELRDHLRILSRHWVGVLLILLLTVAAAAAFTFTRTKVYAADANALVSTGGASNAAIGNISDELARSKAVSYVVIAEGNSTAERVINDLDLGESPGSLATRISVDQPVDTPILKITARAGTPQEAKRLANAYVEALAAEVRAIEDPQRLEKPGTPRITGYGSAALPTTPVSPKPVQNLAFAALIGLLLGYGYALLRHNLDRRLRGPQDVQDRFGVAVLGAVPTSSALGADDATARAQVVLEDQAGTKQWGAAEAFRKLRTNLIFMRVDDPPRVMVITSPQPGDGKSTVAANLAAAVAVSGQAVVLVDGDLRRPTVATAMGVDEAVGLTDVLVGRIPVEDAIQPSGRHEHLHVLPAGLIPPNPSELLGSQAMRTLLKSLSEDYLVVVDAPPLLPVTDAAVLTASADGALVVISAGRTVDAELEQALASLEAVNGRALGVIMNRTSKRSDGGYYYYESTYYGRDAGGSGPASPPTEVKPVRVRRWRTSKQPGRRVARHEKARD